MPTGGINMANRRDTSAASKHKWIARRKTISPKTTTLSRDELIKSSSLDAGRMLPLVIEPNVESVHLYKWVSNNMEFIERKLLEHGAILFRGFEMRDQGDFSQFIRSTGVQLMHYMEGATPRVQLSDKIYTSTEYPADQSIALHNELSYVITWPMKIFFFCTMPAQQGGETPVADVRRVYRRINPKIVERFAQKGWMLIRNFGDGLSLPWQVSYRVSDRSKLERYCRESQIECEWKDDNHVRTRQVRPAVRKHPKTGEVVWFNHVAFWHISSLRPEMRELFLAQFSGEELPYNTYYGDGAEIEDSVVEDIREAYKEEAVTFGWRKGDLLMMDNMIAAHGRNPYSGPRAILASMGEPYSE
jgi:alpha-ketoglutarate-dependent taurine dioxygenase